MVKAFRPDGTSFDWTTVYRRAGISFSIETERGYLEVYEQSFGGPGGTELYQQASTWRSEEG